MSEPVSLNFGLPQGSVLGPQWFTIYTYPIGNIVRRHNFSFHLYADDTQIYFAFKPHDSRQNILRIQSCIEDIRLWMRDNFLKLNDSKTEFLVIGSKHQKAKTDINHIVISNSHITPSNEARNLGFIIDSDVSQTANIINSKSRLLSNP